MSAIQTFRALLDKGQDSALLRYSLGNEYLKQGKFAEAILHLGKALELNPDYSAVWKAYAKALAENNQIEAAIIAYKKGIAVAEKNGDQQTMKEMRVFLKRLLKS